MTVEELCIFASLIIIAMSIIWSLSIILFHEWSQLRKERNRIDCVTKEYNQRMDSALMRKGKSNFYCNRNRFMIGANIVFCFSNGEGHWSDHNDPFIWEIATPRIIHFLSVRYNLLKELSKKNIPNDVIKETVHSLIQLCLSYPPYLPGSRTLARCSMRFTNFSI